MSFWSNPHFPRYSMLKTRSKHHFPWSNPHFPIFSDGSNMSKPPFPQPASLPPGESVCLSDTMPRPRSSARCRRSGLEGRAKSCSTRSNFASTHEGSPYLVAHPTNRKWVTTLVINGISGVSPLISGVITHLLSGMNHQVGFQLDMGYSHIWMFFFEFQSKMDDDWG